MLERRAKFSSPIALFCLLQCVLAQPLVGEAADGQQAILAMLHQRVAQDPLHADSWRLIGKCQHRSGDIAAARNAFDRALQIAPDSAAIHFDYGNLLHDTQDFERAAFHFRRVYALAPESGYAGQLAERGIRFEIETAVPDEPPSGGGGLLQAGYEVKTFDSSEDVEQRIGDVVLQDAGALEPELSLPLAQRLRTYVEFGALYNSNVTLAPISRQLAAADARSAQGFLSPEFELIAAERDGNRIGGFARGYFSFNEGNLSEYNLASFQPGFFFERDGLFGRTDLTGRIDYGYTLDLFGGHRLGDRHSLTTSATSLRPGGDIVHAFWTISFSQFDDDGPTPAIDSLDGVANTFGVTRFFTWDSAWIPSSSLGVSAESADTEGADFRYDGASLNGDLTVALRERLTFIPEASVGYRRYDDFTGPVDRDELVWRVGGKLRWQWTPSLAVSAVAGYDRFGSDNELFDADRTQAGIVWTLLR